MFFSGENKTTDCSESQVDINFSSNEDWVFNIKDEMISELISDCYFMSPTDTILFKYTFLKWTKSQNQNQPATSSITNVLLVTTIGIFIFLTFAYILHKSYKRYSKRNNPSNVFRNNRQEEFTQMLPNDIYEMVLCSDDDLATLPKFNKSQITPGKFIGD